jgi:hypothetical protein
MWILLAGYRCLAWVEHLTFVEKNWVLVVNRPFGRLRHGWEK